MRMAGPAIVIWITGFFWGLMGFTGCSDEPIGQPCTFAWPVQENGDSDCSDFPACAPLQDTSLTPGDSPKNDRCPLDCIQFASLECTNLICAATQVERAPSGSSETDASRLMNGQCNSEVVRNECNEAGQASYGCMGYCTKECLSDASCPKGYRCVRIAPFEENIRCDDESLWGGDVDDPATNDTKCTDECLSSGTDLGGDRQCPGTVEEGGKYTYDYELCQYGEYAKCCACMCYRYCPLLVKKYCRKIEWDEDLFPNGKLPADSSLKCKDNS